MTSSQTKNLSNSLFWNYHLQLILTLSLLTSNPTSALEIKCLMITPVHFVLVLLGNPSSVKNARNTTAQGALMAGYPKIFHVPPVEPNSRVQRSKEQYKTTFIAPYLTVKMPAATPHSNILMQPLISQTTRKPSTSAYLIAVTKVILRVTTA